MPITHTVVEGDSVAKLADRYGLPPQKIWDDPANRTLRELRGDMNILHPGDILIIPDKEPRLEKRPTGESHMFQVLNTPALFRLQIFDMHNPRANQDFTLSVDTSTGVETGKTDKDGILEKFVDPSATEGTIVIGPDNQKIVVRFGHLNPIGEISGLQQRLRNLGYECGEPATSRNVELDEAINDFRRDHKLIYSDDLLVETRKKLQKVHDEPFLFPTP